jgi:hypothetical protein
MSEYREWARRAAVRRSLTPEACWMVYRECILSIDDAENLYDLARCGGSGLGWGPIVREWCNMTGKLEIWLAAA